jgi:hypothetical protein
MLQQLRPIINRYIATSVLLYVQGCNRKFYNTYVLSRLNTKRYVSDNTKKGYPSSLNLLYNMSDNTTKQSQQLCLTLLYV